MWLRVRSPSERLVFSLMPSFFSLTRTVVVLKILYLTHLASTLLWYQPWLPAQTFSNIVFVSDTTTKNTSIPDLPLSLPHSARNSVLYSTSSPDASKTLSANPIQHQEVLL
jgi:hypothetical protein